MESEQTSALPGQTAALEASHLGKTVADASGSLTILDDINLVVQAGETIAILGASGSGKSTLLGLLAGLDVPSTGSVRLFGEELFALDEDGRARLRARRVGFVFQSFQLLGHLSALENVLLPMELAADGRVAAGRDAASDMLARVGLRERLAHYPTTLSGGEQQRVALARAFVAHPSILMADEPTGSLDAKTGESIADLLFELNRESGSTLILVTHDPHLAGRCARRVTLQSGRISRDPQA